MKSKSYKITSFIIIFLSILLFFLIYKYISTDSKKYYFFYSCAVALSIIFWTFILFLNDNIKEKLLLVVITTYITLLFIEVYLNITQHYRELGANKYTYYKKYLKKDDKYVMPIYPSLFSDNELENKNIFYLDDFSQSIYPLTGISKRPTLMCAESGFWVTYNSDRFGFNNNDNVWDNKNIDILLIGDSFVHGFCVKNENNFSGKIQKYSNKNVISIGYGGTGPLIQLAQLIEYGIQKNPKKIIWFYGEGNDLQNLKNEMTNSILKKYLNKNFSQDLMNKQNLVDDILIKILQDKIILNEKLVRDEKNKNRNLFIKNIFKLYLVRKNTINKILNFENSQDIINEAKNVAIQKDKDVGDLKNLNDFENIMKNAKVISQDIGSEMYFVYLPTFSRYHKILKHDTEEKMFNRQIVLDIIKNLEIPIIDLHLEVFKKVKDPISFYPYRKNRHFNKDAFDKASQVIANDIM